MPRNGCPYPHNKKLSSSFYPDVLSLYDGKPGGFLIKNKNIVFSPHSHPAHHVRPAREIGTFTHTGTGE